MQVYPDLPPITHADLVLPGAPLTDYEREVYFNIFSPSRGVEFEMRVQQDEMLVQRVLAKLHENRYLKRDDLLTTLEGISDSVATMRRYVGLLKAPAMAEWVKNELDQGQDKIVLFCMHVQAIKALQEALRKDYGAVVLYGGTPPRKKKHNQEKFLEDPRTRVFIGQIQAAGEAIDLSSASQVVMVEAAWSPGMNAQAIMRVRNVRQKNKKILVRWASLAGSIDEHVQRVWRRKAKHDLDRADNL